MSTIVTISIKLFPLHLARCCMSNISLDHPYHPIYLQRQNEYIGNLIFPKGTRKLREVNDLLAQVHLVINLRNWDASKSQSSCWKALTCSLRFLLREPWNWQTKSILGQALTRDVSPNLFGIAWALGALPSALHSHYFQLFPPAVPQRPVCTGRVLCCLSLLLTPLWPALLEIDTHGRCPVV